MATYLEVFQTSNFLLQVTNDLDTLLRQADDHPIGMGHLYSRAFD